MAKRDEPIAQLATRRRSGRQRILVSPSPAAPKSPATPTSSAGKTAPAPRGTPRHPTSSAATIRPSLTAHARLHVRTSSVGRMRRHPKAPSSQGPTSSAARTIASRAASGSSRIRTSSAVGTSGTPTVTSWSAVRTSSAARIAANEAPRLRDGSTPGQSALPPYRRW